MEFSNGVISKEVIYHGEFHNDLSAFLESYINSKFGGYGSDGGLRGLEFKHEPIVLQPNNIYFCKKIFQE